MKNQIDLNKIKLVIWDLDDTFWKGTFSEEKVIIIPENIELVKKLNKRGIVSSICSKNNEQDILIFLKKLNISDQFVFKSINWESKAPRIKSIIERMRLREENVLLIDDNARNLGEASYLMPKIMTSTPEIINLLIHNIDVIGKDDANLDRLNQYKVLETKLIEQSKFDNEERFLSESKIVISIIHNFEEFIDRICELNKRAHQLNYTKKELTPSDLHDYRKDKNMECGLIECRDKYGEYGIIGFYALSKEKNHLEHYFFSCRTLGMHIEQYVYQLLGYPAIEVIQPVTIPLQPESNICYVKVTHDYGFVLKEKAKDPVLIVGPCDLETIDYFLPWNAATEFRYFDEKSRLIGYGSHPLVLLNALEKRFDDETAFFNKIVYDTTIFSGQYKLVIYSYLTALLYGEYENKITKNRIVYGEWPFDATNHNDFAMNKNVGFSVDKNLFDSFANRYLYIGRVSPNEQAKRIIQIVDKIISSGDTDVCLIEASEKPYDYEKNDSFIDAAEYASKINNLLTTYYRNNKRVSIINPTDFITTQDDYLDSIQHYSRKVYKCIADKIVSLYPHFLSKKVKKNKPELLSRKRKIRHFLSRLKRLFKK